MRAGLSTHAQSVFPRTTMSRDRAVRSGAPAPGCPPGGRSTLGRPVRCRRAAGHRPRQRSGATGYVGDGVGRSDARTEAVIVAAISSSSSAGSGSVPGVGAAGSKDGGGLGGAALGHLEPGRGTPRSATTRFCASAMTRGDTETDKGAKGSGSHRRTRSAGMSASATPWRRRSVWVPVPVQLVRGSAQRQAFADDAARHHERRQ